MVSLESSVRRSIRIFCHGLYQIGPTGRFNTHFGYLSGFRRLHEFNPDYRRCIHDGRKPYNIFDELTALRGD